MSKTIVLVLLMLLVLAGTAMAVPVQWTENGHFYERIDGDLTWDQARAAANGMTYNDLQGHLVTITSADENLFLTNHADLGDGEEYFDNEGNYLGGNLLHYHWIGGYQPTGSGEPGGGWSWVTGETFVYNNWGGFYDDDGNLIRTEPNNNPDNENRIVFDGGFLGDGKNWNDLTGSWRASGFVVEFDTLRDTANIPAVPEPSTILLLGGGLLALLSLRKRIRA